MGDFNDMLSSEDKRGGSEQPQWLIRGFREAVQDSRLIDLPMEGYPFTWIKSRRTTTPTEERLDRALATQQWLEEFPHFKFINAIADRSDHSPILLRLVNLQKENRARVFKFENSWLEEQQLQTVVEGAWNRTAYDPLLAKLQQCTEDLEEWGTKPRLRFKRSITEYREEMERYRDNRSELGMSKYN
ncbi:endonuclease/exonuclease/phosphatase family protein, partial [Trifolium medium]|nr:endonuclease/exonuclease/phosphatase family protein [Trifolium medium]